MPSKRVAIFSALVACAVHTATAKPFTSAWESWDGKMQASSTAMLSAGIPTTQTSDGQTLETATIPTTQTSDGQAPATATNDLQSSSESGYAGDFTTTALTTVATAGATATIPTGVQVASSCTLSMDGQLPTYTPAGFEFSGNVRRFYVAAEEVEWNYVPTGWDNWLGVPIEDSPRANRASALTYGTTYTKAVYRGYTDATFTEQTEQPPWQGIQGPTLRAEVGDMIEILFVNNLETFYATMHSMGLAYTKVSEGADYPNATSEGINATIPAGSAVPPVEPGVAPGGCVTYKWLVTNNAGPAVGEPAKTHSYHSYVSLHQDSNAGLIGPTIIHANGMMESTMAEYREIPMFYMIFDENTSFYSSLNANKLAGRNTSVVVPNIYGGNESIWYPQVVNIEGSDHFSDASSYYSMNGYIFANNPLFEMCLNDKVIWYVNAYGGASHVFHMHGNGFQYEGIGQYAISINDGVGKTLYQNATGVGSWQVICHVGNHHALGMVLNYKVYDGGCPLTPLA